MAYVAFDVNKGIISVSEDPKEAHAAAVFYAKKEGDTGVGFDAEQGHDNARRHSNPPPLQISGLDPLSEREVMSLSPEDAHSVLAPYFPVQSGRGYAPYTPGTAQPLHIVQARGFLKQNAKLSKDEVDESLGERPSVAYGLSLIPAHYGYDMIDSNQKSILVPDKRWAAANKFAASLRPAEPFNLCPWSTPECRRSCLVKTGQNDAVKNYSKLLMTFALQNHPREFVRLLIHSLDKYFFSPPPRIADKFRFVRLNVYSDIVWEQFVPWLFARYPAEVGGYYDYTKIASRIGNTPYNYDLTFSYSGEAMNIKQCLSFLRDEITRCAVVFLVGKNEWKDKFKHGPTTFMGFPVVNGDRHDFRPFDPKGVWTALRWKTPKGLKAAGGVSIIKKFVVRADLIDGEWITSVQPRATPTVEEIE